MAWQRQGDGQGMPSIWARDRHAKPGFKEPLALILGQPPRMKLMAYGVVVFPNWRVVTQVCHETTHPRDDRRPLSSEGQACSRRVVMH